MSTVHVCVLDRHCWRMWRRHAAPMRIHIGTRYWDIPILTHISNRRSARIWDLRHPDPGAQQ